MPEWLSFGLNITVVGVIVVFLSLSLISVVIALIRRVDENWQKREDIQNKEALAKEPTIDNITLVLIAAAAATMIQGRFYIKKVRRLLPGDAVRGPWSMQGRSVLLGSHVVPKKR